MPLNIWRHCQVDTPLAGESLSERLRSAKEAFWRICQDELSDLARIGICSYEPETIGERNG
jgi:hypothetical protein